MKCDVTGRLAERYQRAGVIYCFCLRNRPIFT